LDNKTSSIVADMIDDLLHEESFNPVQTQKDSNEDISMTSNNAISKLTGECSIYEITQIHQQLLSQMQATEATQADFMLDVSKVSDVDASFIQLLACCKHNADNNKQKFQLINPSESLSNRIKAMFMEDYFFSVSE